MDQDRQRQVIEALLTRGANQPCPRCGNQNFEVVGEAFVPLNENPGQIVIGGPGVPVFLVACARCGFLAQHAQASLGLMRPR